MWVGGKVPPIYTLGKPPWRWGVARTYKPADHNTVSVQPEAFMSLSARELHWGSSPKGETQEFWPVSPAFTKEAKKGVHNFSPA